MLRHWGNTRACKQIRADRCIAVDQYISEDSLQWEAQGSAEMGAHPAPQGVAKDSFDGRVERATQRVQGPLHPLHR